VVESKEKGKGDYHCQLRKGTGAPSTRQGHARAKGKEKKDKARMRVSARAKKRARQGREQSRRKSCPLPAEKMYERTP
jgi:hypothetical protein